MTAGSSNIGGAFQRSDVGVQAPAILLQGDSVSADATVVMRVQAKTWDDCSELECQ